MAIPIEKSFVVKAPAGRVWEFLTDPRRVATCLPGAAITEQLDDQTYAGTITVKVGPVSASYKGQVRFERLDPEVWTAELTGKGLDVRGKGGADMRMTSRLVERGPNETEVSVVSEVNVTGILAQFGRGMIQDVSDQMFQKFTEAMRAELEGGEPPVTANTLDVVSLGAAVGKNTLLRIARRPVAWAAVVALLLGIYWLWFR